MVRLHLVCGVLLFAFLSWAHGQPVKDQELEEAMMTKLQDLQRLRDEYLYLNRILMNQQGIVPIDSGLGRPIGFGGHFGRNQRSLDSIGGGNLLKRSLDSIGGGNLLKK